MKIVFTPDWFLNNDLMIEIASFMILFLFFLFAIRCFKINNKKNILYLGLGFLLVALGELSAVITKLVLYYDSDITREIGIAIINSHIVPTVDIFYDLGFFFQKVLTLLGFYLIFKIPHSKKLSSEFLLIVYLLFVTAFLSHSLHYIYNLTAFILLFLIVRNYARIYSENRSKNTKVLIIAFSLLLIGQFISIFASFGFPYIIAQILQLVSYITLLFLIINILENGKQEKQNRYSK